MKQLLILGAMLIGMQAQSQLFNTKTGQISFYSKTPLEDIDAINNQVSSGVNLQTGDVAFAALIKGFHFKRALMEEHFNENYMESDKFPKAGFRGKIVNPTAIDTRKDGAYKVMVEGDLTIHNVTRKVTIPATFNVSGGKLQGSSSFKVQVKDYNIKIPSTVAGKIAETIDVTVNCNYEPK